MPAQSKAVAHDHEFDTMYVELKAWRDAYGTTLVPKQVEQITTCHSSSHVI